MHEGFLLRKTIHREPLGGAALTRALLAGIENGGATVHPAYAVKRRGDDVSRSEPPHTSPSFRRFWVEAVAADVKEAVCRVSDTPFDAADNASIPTVAYELPDGTEVQVGADRFNVPEALFRPVSGGGRAWRLSEGCGGGGGWAEGGWARPARSPPPPSPFRLPRLPLTAHPLAASPFPSPQSILEDYGMGDLQAYGGGALTGLPALARGAAGAADVDLRRDLYGTVLLAGAGSMLPSLKERLEKELGDDAAVAAARAKVVSPNNAVEKRFGPWIGGSILASLGSFQQMWMSKAEYEEHGKGLIHRRAP